MYTVFKSLNKSITHLQLFPVATEMFYRFYIFTLLLIKATNLIKKESVHKKRYKQNRTRNKKYDDLRNF